jgi:hypothetical protein
MRTILRFLRIAPVLLAMASAALSCAGELVPTSPTVYQKLAWGEMGVARLRNAPYPDDSRTTGYQTKNGTFAYDGHYDDPAVVFGIPEHYKKSDTVDLIVHFHGWTNEAPKAFVSYHLGEQITSSGKNAIIILPQGPKNAKDSSIGKLQKPDGLKHLVDECIDRMVADGKLNKDVKLGSLILSGHSGGYMPVGRCLALGGMNDHIKEIWLFDAAYGEHENYANALIPLRGSMRLRSLFTDHLMDENVQLASMLNLGGTRTAIFDEDQITSSGTSAAAFQRIKIHSLGAKPGTDELDSLLTREPIFFMHTHLAHDRVIDERGYFEKFARTSPNLH